MIELPGKDERKREEDVKLSDGREKRIDQLPEHAQHIFKKAHASALKEYEDPKKRRRGGAKEDVQEVAHKVAWDAVKKNMRKRMMNGLRNRSINDLFL